MPADPLQAMRSLITNQYKFTQGYARYVDEKKIRGNMSYIVQKTLQAITCSGCGGLCLNFFEVEEGSLQPYTDGAGKNGWYGPGVHMRWGVGWKLGTPGSLKDIGTPLINGTEGFVNIEQGTVGLMVKCGQPLILEKGNHFWSDPDVKFVKIIPHDGGLVPLGPYTLVTVDEGFAAITSDNGQQVILPGGTATMLTHKNWQFRAMMSLKIQSDPIGPFLMTTGDNISVNVTAQITWQVTDAKLAAARNVDLLLDGRDPLGIMRADVHAQTTSSLAALMGRIMWGSSGKEADEKGEMKAADPNRLDRKALYDPNNLQAVIEHTNSFTTRYGATVIGLNIQTAEPENRQLHEILQKGALASVRSEELAKAATANAQAELTQAKAAERQAKAYSKEQLVIAESKEQVTTIAAQGDLSRAKTEAEALIIKAQADAQAAMIKAEAEAEAVKFKAQGQMAAGQALEESKVATALEKLRIAYSPFTGPRTKSFFFGIDGPGELPKALMGAKLAKEVGMHNTK